ncbi:MAG TPA: transglutaminase-like domain-containing protein [Caulobacteraceae bacterium]|nr:transglutaminase-like domain-containing protein [Caulobacteraceae bacterium]
MPTFAAASPADVRAFYLAPAKMTDLPPELEATPADVAGVFSLVQGVVMHPFWAQAYGQTLTPEREKQTHTRSASYMLELIRRLDPSPLAVARPPEREFTGNCRHHSVLASALLRRAGVPARARCGFALYFDGTPVDHWVVEYWDGAAWRLGDAQLDAVQRAALKPRFDPLDVPRDAFLVGGEAWRRCRAGEADPTTFGIMDMHGLWFVAGNLVRDIAALNNMEMLPWDVWGAMWEPGQEPSPETLEAFDAAAPLSLDPDPHFGEIRALYERPEWRVPPRVFNAVAQRMDTV